MEIVAPTGEHIARGSQYGRAMQPRGGCTPLARAHVRGPRGTQTPRRAHEPAEKSATCFTPRTVSGSFTEPNSARDTRTENGDGELTARVRAKLLSEHSDKDSLPRDVVERVICAMEEEKAALRQECAFSASVLERQSAEVVQLHRALHKMQTAKGNLRSLDGEYLPRHAVERMVCAFEEEKAQLAREIDFTQYALDKQTEEVCQLHDELIVLSNENEHLRANLNNMGDAKNTSLDTTASTLTTPRTEAQPQLFARCKLLEEERAALKAQLDAALGKDANSRNCIDQWIPCVFRFRRKPVNFDPALVN
mmetsp:Transcript_36649/g.82506  ORF Transcript_36649/g.82506 Transcript_36649/m.82506 type:complete len:308 (-) Transcript_36649:129-1052(-)